MMYMQDIVYSIVYKLVNLSKFIRYVSIVKIRSFRKQLVGLAAERCKN